MISRRIEHKQMRSRYSSLGDPGFLKAFSALTFAIAGSGIG
ncbi:MAG: hypothetical protein AAGA60_22595 [Cyanobacteria bacterium P01_E01_bin.42]